MGFFKDWLTREGSNRTTLLPITHITKGVSARKIISAGRIDPIDCEVLNQKLVYTFYGRVAYRVAGDGVIKMEAVSPVCFVFEGELVNRSRRIHPFDTGAYSNRLYKHAFADELSISDFEISGDPILPNALIDIFFGSTENYFIGDTRHIPSPDELCVPSEMEVRAYHELISSSGRNEPDDRVYSIEVAFADPLLLSQDLKAIIVPHTFWCDQHRADWLNELNSDGVEIATYEFHPNRPPDYYHAHLELQLRDLFRTWGYFEE